MVLKRWYTTTVLAALLALTGGPAVAQDEPAPTPPPETPTPTAPADTPPTPTPAPETPTPTATATATESASTKPPWWGGRNMLFLQIGYGTSSFDTIRTSVSTEAGSFSDNYYEIDDNITGRFTVGWTLPEERGRFLLNFEGIKEESYSYDAVGQLTAAVGATANSAPLEPIPWWYVSVRDGVLTATKTPPVWDGTITGTNCINGPSQGQGCDRNSDGRASADEVAYPTVEQQGTAGAAKSLNNDIRTYDFLYAREFGGRRIWGDWSAGLRYFDYSGAVPIGAWLIVLSSPGEGYTDGLTYPPLLMQQDTTGLGPTGSLGLNFGFFRRRLVLHAGARVSYVMSSLETTSGDFVTLINDSGNPPITAPANLTQGVDKSVWHLQAKIAARFEVFPGFNIIADYQSSGFQDALLFPVSLSIPDTPNQVNQGTVAVYGTRDFRVKSFMAGVSFQF